MSTLRERRRSDRERQTRWRQSQRNQGKKQISSMISLKAQIAPVRATPKSLNAQSLICWKNAPMKKNDVANSLKWYAVSQLSAHRGNSERDCKRYLPISRFIFPEI